MNLTYWEQDWVHDRMKEYDIKYQEIYNELFDHITTVIEEQREAGDTNTVQVLYEQVVEKQFGGYWGIVKVAASYEKSYKSKVKKMIWSNYRYYINYQSLLFIMILMGISFALPATKLTFAVLFGMILIGAAYSSAYAYITLRVIKPSKGKTSLVYSHIISQANFPLMFVNMVWVLPRCPSIFFNDKYNFDSVYIHYPAILILLLALLLIYDLSCMRLCRQELKGFVNINS